MTLPSIDRASRFPGFSFSHSSRDVYPRVVEFWLAAIQDERLVAFQNTNTASTTALNSKRKRERNDNILKSTCRALEHFLLQQHQFVKGTLQSSVHLHNTTASRVIFSSLPTTMIPSTSKVWEDDQVNATDTDTMTSFNDQLKLVTVGPGTNKHSQSSNWKAEQSGPIKAPRTRFHQSAVMDVPFRYHSNGELKWDPTGHFSVSSISPLTAHCDLHLAGQTLLRGKSGVSTTSAHVTYRYSDALTFQNGCSIGTSGSTGAAYAPANVRAAVIVKALSIPTTVLPGCGINPQSVITVSVAAPVQHDLYKYTCVSISSRRNVFSPLWTIAFNGSYRLHDMTPTLATTLYCNSKNSWDLQVGFWSKQKTIYPTIRLGAQFAIGSIKTSCRMLLNAPGIQWTLQWRTKRKKKKKSSLSISLSRNQKDWLSWIFTWTVGDMTMRIPLIISLAGGSTFALSICTIYMSLVSKVILDVVAQVTQPQKETEAIVSNRSQSTVEQQIQQRRQDATQQQDLMKRLASIRKQQEEQKANGLVIEQALYYTDDTSWDVTVPLQFWVSEDSTLELPAGSKQGMLGFYDIALENSQQHVKENPRDIVAETASSKETTSWWWSWCCDFWTLEEKKPLHRSPQTGTFDTTTAVPRLRVRYRMGEKSFEITINDEQELRVPSDLATIVAPYRIVLNY